MIKKNGENKERNWEKSYIFLLWHDIGLQDWYHGVKDDRGITTQNLRGQSFQKLKFNLYIYLNFSQKYLDDPQTL